MTTTRGIFHENAFFIVNIKLMIETSKKWEGIPVLKNLASLKICCSDWFPVLLS